MFWKIQLLLGTHAYLQVRLLVPNEESRRVVVEVAKPVCIWSCWNMDQSMAAPASTLEIKVKKKDAK